MRTDKPITLLLRVVCSFVCACVHVPRSVSVRRTLHIASHRIIILLGINPAAAAAAACAVAAGVGTFKI